MLSRKDRVEDREVKRRWQIPKENLYPGGVYQAKLAAAGFSNVFFESIWNDVVPPWHEFARTRLADVEVASRMNPVLLRRLITGLSTPAPPSPLGMDYVLVYAEKAA